MRRQPHRHLPVQQLENVIAQAGERFPALRAAVPAAVEIPDHLDPRRMRVIPPSRARPRPARPAALTAARALPVAGLTAVIPARGTRLHPLRRPPER